VTTRQVDECFSDLGGIAHYELREAGNGGHVLRFVPEGSGPAEAALRRVTAQLGELLGAAVAAGAMPVLLPEPSGKFRLARPAPANPPARA